MKGKAAKIHDEGNKYWMYKVIFGVWQMHGSEGEKLDYARDVSSHTGVARHNNHDILYVNLCANQDDEYDFRSGRTSGQKRSSSGIPSERRQKRAKTPHETMTPKQEPDTNTSGTSTSDTSKSYRPFTFVDSDSEKEEMDTADLKKEINALKAKLAALAAVTERIHSMIDPILRQHKTATKIIKTLQTKESDSFITANKAIISKVVTTGNDAQSTFANLFPVLAGMLFFHRDDGQPSKELTDWREGCSDKTVQNKDKECDSSEHEIC